MKIGVSSLAWESSLDNKGYFTWLAQTGIKAVEVAIPRHIGSWDSPTLSKLFSFLETLQQFSITPVSAQAIYFRSGVSSLDTQESLKHFRRVSDLCKVAGIEKLVIGAPTLRRNLPVTFLEMLHRFNAIAAFNDQTILLEPNSKAYGGEYFFTVGEIVGALESGHYSNVKTMIDTHNIILENQSPVEVYLQYRDYIMHVHVSEKNLEEFQYSNAHSELVSALQKSNYSGAVIYEAKPSPNIFQGIEKFTSIYTI